MLTRCPGFWELCGLTTFETVAEKKIMTDGNQVIELYHQQNYGHNDRMLLVYQSAGSAAHENTGHHQPLYGEPGGQHQRR
jgi:hypothetical protein